MAQLMTEKEKAETFMKTEELRAAGKKAEADALRKTIPMPPWLVKFAKKEGHLDFLIKDGWNMAEAEAAFGSEWFAT